MHCIDWSCFCKANLVPIKGKFNLYFLIKKTCKNIPKKFIHLFILCAYHIQAIIGFHVSFILIVAHHLFSLGIIIYSLARSWSNYLPFINDIFSYIFISVYSQLSNTYARDMSRIQRSRNIS